MPLKLAVPAADKGANLAVETRSKQVKEWLDTLPLANAFEASRMVRDGLATLNRQKIAIDQRLKLLELYQATVNTLLPVAEELFFGVPLPLPEKSRQAAALARDLHVELAYGYKIVLLDLLNKRLGFGANRLLPQAVQGALSALGNILVVCYQTYAPTPAGIWSEMHQLYRFALQQDIHDEPLEGDEPTRSIAHAYKQALLLALADPYRLMPGEVGRTLGYLVRFGNQAQLLPMAPVSNKTGLFLIRLDSDKPPRPLPQDTAATDTRADMLLNTVDLVRLLHHQLTRLEAGESPAGLDLPQEVKTPPYLDLMRRLIRHWGITPRRYFGRIRNEATVEICAGVWAIHYFLSGETSFRPPETATREEEEGITVTGTNSMPGAVSRSFDCTRWEIANESAGGLALRKQSNETVQIRVGEVIGLRALHGDAWSVGAVRWVQSGDPDHLEVGIQMLAPTAVPATVRPTIASAAEVTQPALLLPEMPLLKQAPALLVPRSVYHHLKEYHLGQNGDMNTIRATRLLEQTASYELFQFG